MGKSNNDKKGLALPGPSARAIEGLTALAANGGNIKRTARNMKAGRDTVRKWRDAYPEKYAEIYRNFIGKVEEQQLAAFSEVASRSAEVLQKALDETEALLDAHKDKQPAATARNLVVVGGTAFDKARLVQDQPTVIVEQRSTEEILDDIARKLGKVVDVEVVEESPPTKAT